MSDILIEMNEAMRQERMEKFWKENGNTLIVFVIATIIMTGAISAYRAWDASAKIKGTEKIMVLMDDKTFPDNIRDTKLDVRGGLRGVALINGAKKYLDDKKPDDALALYTRAAEDSGIPAEMRDLAVLMQVRLTADAVNNDAIMKNLDRVAGNSGSPWQYHAKVEAAAFAAEKQDYKRARTLLAGVLDQESIPETLYKKAQALDHVYALKDKTTATTDKAGS